MKTNEEICENCSFPKSYHSTEELWCNANGWKFKPQNQSPLRNPTLDVVNTIDEDTLRGIFDTTDLEKGECPLCKGKKNLTIYQENFMPFVFGFIVGVLIGISIGVLL